MRWITLLALCTLLAPVPTAAQRRAWRADAGSFRIEESTITGVGIALAALLAPTDARARSWAIGPGSGVPGLAPLDGIFRPMGGRIPLVAAGGAWLVGAAAGMEEVAAGGRITVESLLATALVKGALQRVIGRMRLNVEPHDPWDFRLGRGFRDRASRSFPSGHAANAFALAAAVNEELHHVGSSANPWVSSLLYGAASATSLSRVVDDQHWLSDVVAGGVLGGVVAALVADANGR